MSSGKGAGKANTGKGSVGLRKGSSPLSSTTESPVECPGSGTPSNKNRFDSISTPVHIDSPANSVTAPTALLPLPPKAEGPTTRIEYKDGRGFYYQHFLSDSPFGSTIHRSATLHVDPETGHYVETLEGPDFNDSKSSVPSFQTPASSFWSLVDSFTRPLQETDLKILENDLEAKPETEGPLFRMPPKGEYYKDVWEKGAEYCEKYYFGFPESLTTRASLEKQGIAAEEADASLCPLSERVISSLLQEDVPQEIKRALVAEDTNSPTAPSPRVGISSRGVKRHYPEVELAANEESMSDQDGTPPSPASSGMKFRFGKSSPAPVVKKTKFKREDSNGSVDKDLAGMEKVMPDPIDLGTLEDRIFRELQAVGVFHHEDEMPKEKGRHEREDDEIAVMLRAVQHELAVVMKANRERKAKLLEVARKRMAWHEFLQIYEEAGKQIEASLQKRVTAKQTKWKKSKKPSEDPLDCQSAGLVPVSEIEALMDWEGHETLRKAFTKSFVTLPDTTQSAIERRAKLERDILPVFLKNAEEYVETPPFNARF